MDSNTAILVVLAIGVGVLGSWVYSLKRQIRSMQEQIAGLITVLTNTRGTPNEHEREALGRLGRASRMDLTPGGIWH